MTTLELRSCTVDLDRRLVRRAGDEVALTALEARFLEYLARHSGRALCRRELLTEVWGYAPGVRSDAVKKSVNRLRAKIEAEPSHPDHLLAVPGVGYRFEVSESIQRVADTNLGAPRTALVGREALLDQVVALMPQRRLVSLTGHAGAGKTRLAQAVGRRLAEGDGFDRVWFVDLADASSATAMTRALWSSVGIERSAGLERLGTALLILDNLEQLLPVAVPAVGMWLDDAPALRLLITSRERLNLRGEHVIAVPPLAIDDGVELFVSRARAVGADVAPGADVEAIVRRLDGLPLAIEMAASRTDLVPVLELLDQLDLGQLTLAQRDRPARHQDLETALTQSWALLEPGSQRALSRLSAFRGGFDLAAAGGVAQLGADDVRDLLHKSLIRGLGPGRWGLYEGLRQLAARDALPDAPRIHARYFATVVPDRIAEPGWLAREEANLRQALRGADDDHLPWLAYALARRGMQTGLVEEDEWMAARLDAVAPAAVPQGAVLLHGSSLLAHLRGDSAALARMDRAWDLALDDSPSVLAAIARDGALMAIEGTRFDVAEAWLARSATVGRDDIETRAWLRVRQRHYDQAVDLFSGLLAQVDDPWDRQRTLALMTVPLVACRQFGAAEDAARRSLAIAEGHGRGVLQSRTSLALVCMQTGRTAEARRHLQANITDLRQAGARERLGVALAQLALTCVLDDDPEEAEPDARVAVGHLLATRSPYRDLGWLALGVSVLMCGDAGEAHAALLHLDDAATPHWDARWTPASLAFLGRFDEARAVLASPHPWSDGGVHILWGALIRRLSGSSAVSVPPSDPAGERLEVQLARRLLDRA